MLFILGQHLQAWFLRRSGRLHIEGVVDTFKVSAAAISTCHKGFGDRLVFSHPYHYVKCFSQGVRRQHLVQPGLAGAAYLSTEAALAMRNRWAAATNL